MINHTHKILLRLCSLLFVLMITACTDGDRGFVPLPVEPEEEKPADILVTGAGVKGPLINAEVKIYRLELDKGEIYPFSAALKKWYELLSQNEVVISDEGISTGTIPAATVVTNLIETYEQFGFTSQLPQLKKALKDASSFADAETIVSDYLAKETNSKVRERITKLNDSAATLNDYKAGIKDIKSLTDELLETNTFAEARAVLVNYKATEDDATNIDGFNQAIATLDNFRSKANAFGITSIRNAYKNDIYDVFLSRFDVQNNPYSRLNLINLNEALATINNVEDAKAELQKGYDKESNAQLKAAISKLIARIITLENVKVDILGRESLYHNYKIQEVILADPAPNDLSTLYSEVSQRLSNNLEPSFRKSLIIKDEEDEDNEAENLISFGETNEQGLLPGLRVNQYRGFVYMVVKSIGQTVDLNSGQAPIISTLESIFHTDDIVGNGAENSEDKTLYYILNGIEQRDADGKLISDRSLITTTNSDELIEVRPLFTATPFTQLGLDIALEKMKTLQPFRQDSNSDGMADSMINKDLLTNILSDTSDLIVESLGIGMSDETNIFRSPSIRLPQMKYNKASELAAIQHRFSIENFAAFVQDIRNRTNLKGTEILDLIAEDLLDNQLDAKKADQEITAFASIPEYTFLFQSDPFEKNIPGTNTAVSDIYYVMNDELSITQPNYNLSGFNVKRSDLVIHAPKTGLDSDGDKILDNDDTFPFDDTKSRELNPGYAGIWSLVFDASEYSYMPFKQDLTFTLNKEQIEGVCTNSPCIGLGDLSTTVTAKYELIKSPAKHDFNLTPFSNGTSSIGFTAFATVPGNYLVKATYSADVTPVQTYQIIIPIQVIDPKSIELRFNPEVPSPGKLTKVEFRATKGLCALYSFCSDQMIDLDDNIPDYLNINLLADIFYVEQTITRNGIKQNYTGVESNSLAPANLSNLEVNDVLNVEVKFKAGVRDFTAKSASSNTGGTVDSDSDGVPDTVDVFPLDGNCSLEKDGILDSNLDGALNNLDTPKCFETYIDEATEELDISFLNETWFYNKDWHYIIRKNKYLTGYNGLILLPTVKGTKQFITDFVVDNINKRAYFAYKNAAVDYFSFESQEITNFSEGQQFTQINSLHMIGSYLLVEYDLGGSNLSGKLFNPNGQAAKISGADEFPKPAASIDLQIDGLNFLTATNNLLAINWQIERKINSVVTPITPQTSNDKRTLLSGQTLFADVIKLELSYNTSDNRTIQILENLFVLNLNTMEFENDNFHDDESLVILFDGFDSSVLASSNTSLYVNWYKNDENTNSFQFINRDIRYPFLLEESNFVFGDMIRAEVMLAHGNDQLLVKQLNAVILGDLRTLIPTLDDSKSSIDLKTRQVSYTLAKPSANDEYYSLETFTPVWRINGIIVNGENGFTFPQLSTTKLSYGDSLSVGYLVHINGLSVATSERFVTKLNIDPENIEFELSPKVAEVGQDISLDPSYFTQQEMENLLPFWHINGVLDKQEKNLTYPAEKLQYGDEVELLLASRGGTLDDAFDHIAVGSVGVNLQSLTNQTTDPENDLDSDQDGVPNHLDYFRNDAFCSEITEGRPDDIDGDGLIDLDELAIHTTRPSLSDTDKDGLSDFDEINQYGTNALIADTDGDGYLDGVEIDLSTLPLDPSDPNPGVADNDYDGLSNEDEIARVDVDGNPIPTRVNKFDTDSDGLSDWYEINKSLTDPLNPDTDGDGLSDGLEVRTTDTSPINADHDADGIEDGLEVWLGLNPLIKDSDSNGIEDADEPGFDFNQQLPNILYIADLPNYKAVYDDRLDVPAGTCFNRFIIENRPSISAVSHEAQLIGAEQQVAFSSPDWSEIVRYDAKNKVYLESIDLSNFINVGITSLEYDRNNINLIYLGFSDGYIRQYNAQTKVLSDVFIAEPDLAVTKLIDQGDILLAEQINSNGQIVHYSYKENSPVSFWNSAYSYQHSVWLDNNRNELLIVDSVFDSGSFIREQFDTNALNPLINTVQVTSPTALNGPIFIETVEGSELLRFGSGQSYNLTGNTWLSQVIAPFSFGFSHQSHRVLVLKNSSMLEMTTLSTLAGDKYWRFTTQLDNQDVISIIPVGMHLLAITAKHSNNMEAKDISFQTIILGDEDNNNLPDWWQRLSPSLTTADFQNYQLTNDAVIPDFLNGEPNIDDSVQAPVLVDTDGDGICDHWEVNLFGTNPLVRDTDQDGADDFQELGIQNTTLPVCSETPVFQLISDPLNPDTDGDGLVDGGIDTNNDGIIDDGEPYLYITNPLLADTDGDGLTDYQEKFLTNTDPLKADTNGDGTLDGDFDSDGDGLTNAEELNVYQTNPGNPDSDGDGLTDDYEILISGSNPNLADTDGDRLTDFEELNPDTSAFLDPNIDRNGDDLINEEDTALYNAEVAKFVTNPSKRDTDGDGLTDDVELNFNSEFTYITYPTIVDSDGDGLTDAEEFNYLYEYSEPELDLFSSLGITPNLRLNPRLADTDGDGICDIWEARELSTNPAEADTDFDKLSDSAELGLSGQPVNCTTMPVVNSISDPKKRDTDDDNLLDGDEVNTLFTDPRDRDSNDNGITDDKEDFDGDGLTNYQEVYLTKTDPFNPDVDENGVLDALDDFDSDDLSNIFEITTSGTDPLNPDTNGNGLSDKIEYDSGLSSSPGGDTDGDGVTDVDELNNSVPGEADTTKRTDPLNPDSDFDGASDGEELSQSMRTNPLNPDTDHDFLRDGDDFDGLLRPLDEDSDDDGIPDGIEARFLRTSPDKRDSDSDGLEDGTEAWVFAFRVDEATNPLDPPILTNNLLQIGVNKNVPLNSKHGVSGWSLPRPFAANGRDRLVFDLYDMSDDTKLIGKLFVQRFSDPTKQDSDGDGLLDATEFAIEDRFGNGFNTPGFSPLLPNSRNFRISDPWNIDSNSGNDNDNDGLPDWYEIKVTGTNPALFDTNGNGISDGLENSDFDLLNNIQEMRFGSNPYAFDGFLDSDGDGIPDIFEVNLTLTDPYLSDTDKNGVSDGDEDPDQDGRSNRAEIIAQTDPLTSDSVSIDTDGDGVSDLWEQKITLTDPDVADTEFVALTEDNFTISRPVGLTPFDTDGDGLPDIYEQKVLNTSPTLADSNSNGISDALEDSDNDGITNIQEFRMSLNPLVANFGKDSDNDGLSDFEEINLTFTNPARADSNNNQILDRDEDPDNDGISTIDELRQGSDPFNSAPAIDTDGDGLTDYQEINITKTDPANSHSVSTLLNDADVDPDMDGFTNLQEVRLGLDPTVADNLVKDTDNDGLADHIETLITLTISTFADTDGNGISDFNDDADNDGLSNWAEIVLGTDPLVRNLAVDSDRDGLTDFQELNITLTDPNLADTDSNRILDGKEDFDGDSLNNLQEMQMFNDPYVANVLDSHEDVDGDYLINILDQDNAPETNILVADTDGDGIPDGIEQLVLNTNSGVIDTDGDGISDLDELNQFIRQVASNEACLGRETDFTIGNQKYCIKIQPVAANEACLDTETRMTAIAGKDYCVLINYNSYPTLSDSDNDGTPDRAVNPDNSVTLDHFPLDATCSAASDGFDNPVTGRPECFSSWMAGSSDIDMIRASEWQTSGGQERADIILHNQGWDKIIRFNTLNSSYLPAVPVDPTETIVSLDTVSQSRSLFILYSTGRLDRYDMENDSIQTINDLSQAGLNPDKLMALESGDLLVQYKDASNVSTLYLFDQNGIGMDSLSSINIDINDAAFLCAQAACNTLGYVYAFEKDINGVNINLARLEVNLSAKTFNPVLTYANTLSQFTSLKGPIRLSQNNDRVYLASGQKLNLDLQDSDHSQSLAITHKDKTYSEFYDLEETGNHFVGIIDFDISTIPGAPLEPATRNGLIVKDNSPVQKVINTYLLPPISFDERILGLFPYENTSLVEVAIVSKLDDRIVIENLGITDNDGDGMPGIYEKFYGLNDNDLNDKFKDPDTDGFSNIEEYIYGRDPFSNRFDDPDNDGLTNIDEYFYGTDPNSPDTDEDGFDDLYEILNNTNPNDPLSNPGA